MGKIGEIFICAHCGKPTIRTSGGQKYCEDCKIEANYLKSRTSQHRRRVKMLTDKPMKEFACKRCNATFMSKYKRMHCEDCAKKLYVESVKAANKEKAELQKNINPAPVVMPKPKFSLAEVNQAARKHNMSYGQYCAAWKLGRVEEPQPIKKKRGRKSAKVLDW